MYNVLLVDDEPIITRGLQALLDWEDYGFEIVHISENGEDALTFMRENQIHLLITDIMMPKMTGLELIEKAQKIQPHLKCIILSGYQEFDYVKQGMILGIENYLVKPVDEDELLKTIQTVREKLQVSNSESNHDITTLKENTLWRLLNGEIEKGDWYERLSLYEIDFVMPFYNVSILHYENEDDANLANVIKEYIEEQYALSCLFSPDRELIIIFSSESDEELYNLNGQLEKDLVSGKWHTGEFYLSMGDPVDSMEGLEESYLSAREYSMYQIGMDVNILLSNKVNVDKHHLMNIQQEHKADMVKRLLHSKEDVIEGIELFWKDLCQEGTYLAPAVARKNIIDLISYIHHSLKDDRYYNNMVAIEKLVFASNLDEMKGILLDYCNELLHLIDDQSQMRSPIVQNVLEYIHVHYDEELSLKTLSQRFHVNPIYLGQLFQKEVGIVFSEYINRYRLEKAKELLKTTHLRAGEIGKKVGYSDNAYFYKQFKKSVGVTPTEWRKI